MSLKMRRRHVDRGFQLAIVVAALLQACSAPATPSLRQRQADVSIEASWEVGGSAHTFVMEVSNATADEVCVLSPVPTRREAVRQTSVGYIWAASRGGGADWGHVREGPVVVLAIPPRGERQIEMTAQLERRDAAALDWAVSVGVLACDGLERSGDGDFAWDGLRELHGVRYYVGQGNSHRDHISLREAP